ncbi:NAD(P)-dependent dehydrogenase (short-subunit alcohol dehydrogenase family) [Rhizobium leucaenae]|uniref:NAD(P)-dependent dehydrogenase (Short-subunit alcohol dehydrogenase family) n=2 Tax=Rhizobium leucaenae TaxID=29450 RepID=A0A7W7EIM3_9HYPH|nr:NAD(P)-dependent dehydrogenase (short-subunit alcohol dehydrogenase family) [Rhizobium leucaenae]
MSDKTILITGSTDGVGRRVAERLAASGAMVLVHGRDKARAESLLSGIRSAGGKAAFYPADLSSLDKVRALVDAIKHDHDRLDILINNAGIGTSSGDAGRQVSRDGYELRFAVNYLAGFLLTRCLLPLLKASSPARIVNVSSAGQQPIDFSDVMLTRGYSGVRAYCQSKLAQIIFTFDLAEELADTGVTANCLHPATYMDTTMVRQAGVAPMSTVDQGADAILNLAVGAGLEGRTGLYYDGQRPSRANAQAYDAAARHRLRVLSHDLTGLA